MNRQGAHKRNRKIFLTLWILCILGAWLVQPYVQCTELASAPMSWVMRVLLVTVNTMLLAGLACWAAYRLLPKTDLHPFSWDSRKEKIIYPGVIAGVCLGLVIVLLDNTVLHQSQLSAVQVPAWMGFLASFYGGINEEVLFRLFLFTSIYFVFIKIFRFNTRHRLKFLWITNVIVAILFGLGHLPAIFHLMTPSVFEISRILVLNGIAGVVFGWLYWTRGLWTAMTAHFVTDLVIHVWII